MIMMKKYSDHISWSWIQQIVDGTLLAIRHQWRKTLDSGHNEFLLTGVCGLMRYDDDDDDGGGGGGCGGVARWYMYWACSWVKLRSTSPI